jgi:hypothetical protein
MAGRARERRCRRRDHKRSQRHCRKLIKDMARQIFHGHFPFLILMGTSLSAQTQPEPSLLLWPGF